MTRIKEKIKYTFLRETMKRFPDRKRFCPLPFKHIEILENGETDLCCWLRKSAGNVFEEGLSGVYNSPAAQDVRASILDGTFRYCDLEECPYFSSGGLPLQQDCAGTPYEEIIGRGLTALDNKGVWLVFDRRCNLRCVTCRPDYARLSEREEKAAERLMEIVKQDLPRISHIGLSGSGDPFASPVFRDFLINFDSADYPHVKLTLLTNGILLNRRTWESMKKAQPATVSIQVSVDAANRETYEKIRVGGSFETVMDNLRFLSELRREGAFGEFIISFVVNARNFTEMRAFVELGLDLNCDQIYFARMADWGASTRSEYHAQAVHLPGHAEHHALRETLADALFLDPHVFLGNLDNLKPKSVFRESLFF